MWRDVVQDESYRMAGLFDHWVRAVADNKPGVHPFRFQCGCLRPHLFAGTDSEHRWELLPIDSLGTLQRYEEEAQDHSVNRLHPFNHSDHRDCSRHLNQAPGAAVPDHPGICLLLVHHQLHPLWPEDPQKNVLVLHRRSHLILRDLCPSFTTIIVPI